jgi:hypothetical protein
MRGEANWLPFLLAPILILAGYYFIKKMIQKIKDRQAKNKVLP